MRTDEDILNNKPKQTTGHDIPTTVYEREDVLDAMKEAREEAVKGFIQWRCSECIERNGLFMLKTFEYVKYGQEGEWLAESELYPLYVESTKKKNES